MMLCVMNEVVHVETNVPSVIELINTEISVVIVILR